MSFWKKRNKREKIMISVIVVIVLPVAFYFYFYQPLQKDIQVKENKLQQLQKDFETEEKLAAEKRQLQKDYQRIKKELTSNNQVLTKESLSELIINLNRLAQKNNLSLLVFKPQKKEQVKSYLKYPVTLQLGGSYQNMLTYLEDVSQLDYFIRVEKIAFSSVANKKNKTDSSPLTLGIEVVGYNISDSSKGD